MRRFTSRFLICDPSKHCEKHAKKRRFPQLFSKFSPYHKSEPRGRSTHNFASFSYTSQYLIFWGVGEEDWSLGAQLYRGLCRIWRVITLRAPISSGIMVLLSAAAQAAIAKSRLLKARKFSNCNCKSRFLRLKLSLSGAVAHHLVVGATWIPSTESLGELPQQ